MSVHEVSTQPFFPQEGVVYKVQRPLVTINGSSSEWKINAEGDGGHVFKADREWRRLMGDKAKIYVVFNSSGQPELADEQEPGW